MAGLRFNGLVAGTAMLAGMLGGCGERSPAANTPLAKASSITQASSPAAHDDARNRFNWQMNCQGCHGPSGSGNAARDVPELAALDKFQRSQEGREFLIRVPGMSRSPLSDEELTKMANWLMDQFASPGAPRDWKPYSVGEVAELRKRPIIDGIVQHRAKIIASIEKAGG